MTIEQFRQRIKLLDLEARKQPKRDVLNILCYGGLLFSLTYAEIHHLQDLAPIIARKQEALDQRGKANTRQFAQMLRDSGYFQET